MPKESDPTCGKRIPKGWKQLASSQHAVKLNPETWRGYKQIRATGDLPDSIKRDDLAAFAANTNRADKREVLRLFTLTMMWGSGTSNGRGPRNTERALSAKGTFGVLRHSWDLVEAGHAGEAYLEHRRLDGVGPAFHTKWLWVVGTTTATSPPPLILDSRVWNGLAELGWSSVEAAGRRSWGPRYEAYLGACGAWARDLGVEPEDIEFSLFNWEHHQA